MVFHILTSWGLRHIKRLRHAIFKRANFMKPWRIWTDRVALVGIVVLAMIMVVLMVIAVVVVVVIVIVIVMVIAVVVVMIVAVAVPITLS